MPRLDYAWLQMKPHWDDAPRVKALLDSLNAEDPILFFSIDKPLAEIWKRHEYWRTKPGISAEEVDGMMVDAIRVAWSGMVADRDAAADAVHRNLVRRVDTLWAMVIRALAENGCTSCYERGKVRVLTPADTNDRDVDWVRVNMRLELSFTVAPANAAKEGLCSLHHTELERRFLGSEPKEVCTEVPRSRLHTLAYPALQTLERLLLKQWQSIFWDQKRASVQASRASRALSTTGSGPR